MSAADVRGVLIIPLIILAAGLIGYGLVVPTAAAGIALGFCLAGGTP